MPKKARKLRAKVAINVGGVTAAISVTDMAKLKNFSGCLRNLFLDLARQGTVNGAAGAALADPFDRFKRCVKANS